MVFDPFSLALRCFVILIIVIAGFSIINGVRAILTRKATARPLSWPWSTAKPRLHVQGKRAIRYGVGELLLGVSFVILLLMAYSGVEYFMVLVIYLSTLAAAIFLRNV